MRYHIPLTIAFLMLMATAVSAAEDEGCCTLTEVDGTQSVSDEIIHIDEPSDVIWSGTHQVNGSLVVNSTLVALNATLIMGGSKLEVSENGKLVLENSTLESYDLSFTYYIESSGDIIVKNSGISGCLDPGNGYFGLYVYSAGSLVGDGLDMSRSGMIRTDNSTVELSNSHIPGILSLYGDVEVVDCEITSHGVSQIGEGTLVVEDTKLTSNVSFSIGVSAISVLQGGSLKANGIEINGTYNVGIFSSYSSAEIKDIRIILPDGIYGIKSDNSTIGTVDNVTVTGVSGGLVVLGSEEGTGFTNCFVGADDFGGLAEGTNSVEFGSCSFVRSAVGLVAQSPVSVKETTFTENEIGIRMGANNHLKAEDCRFLDYGMWGIEQETWTPFTYPDNEYRGEKAESVEIAWWGEIEIRITGPDGIDVQGTRVKVESLMTTYEKQDNGLIGMVWGYSDGEENVTDIQSELTVKWGSSSVKRSITPTKGDIVEISLPLADLWIRSLDYSDGNVNVALVMNGTDGDNVKVLLYVDGEEMKEYVNLTEGQEMEISFEVDLGEGVHTLRVTATSPDEYTGTGGILLENNDLTEEITLKKEVDNVTTVIWVTVTFIVLLLLLPLFFLERTKVK